MPSEILSAFLYAQLENVELILQKRKNVWNYYHERFIDLEDRGLVKRPAESKHEFNAHIFYLIMKNEQIRDSLIPVSYTHLDVYKRQILYLHLQIWMLTTLF